MIFILAILAVVMAGAIAAFKPRFGLKRPAIAFFLLGLCGAISSMVGMSQTSVEDVEAGLVPIYATLGVLMTLIAVLGLLVLAVLFAHRKWTGFYKEHSP
ncbi:hypothetical protein [uncultured Litoreibacter sp.]|uniref:hypothetical protein n=1 Tax=uncultured Litoreibacter sp. TaxID=1392394 RepID=UPI002606D253|nr:hypothetical protein [uncultured Litoreibacter sp.]